MRLGNTSKETRKMRLRRRRRRRGRRRGRRYRSVFARRAGIRM